MFGQKEPTFIDQAIDDFSLIDGIPNSRVKPPKTTTSRGLNWLYNEGGFAAIAGLLAVTDISNVRINITVND